MRTRSGTDSAPGTHAAPLGAPRGALVGALLSLLLPLAACDGGAAAAGRGGAAGPDVSPAADDPIDFGSVPDFRLTDQDGLEVTLADLAGRPWVLACIYTLCTGPCPSITKELGAVVRRLDGVDARFVSLSVDPLRDQPHVLKRYAEAHGADLERWRFLTGRPEEVERLVRDGFRLPLATLAEPDALTGETITHDQRLTVIDAEGRVRGWYDSQDPAEIALLCERVRFLAAGR